MRNFVQPGNVVTAIAPAGGVTSGALVILGAMFGIAATSAPATKEFELSIGGVYELPKTAAEAWSAGQVIYSTPAGLLTSSASGNTKVGVAVLAATNPSGMGTVRLNASF